MNRTTKIILGVLLGIVALCALVSIGGFLLLRSAGTMLAQNIQTDPAKTTDIASSIAEYSLPSGFGEPYATRVAGFALVAYTGTDNHSHIYFFQAPSSVTFDEAQLQRQMEQAKGNSKDNPARMEVVSSQKMTIRGQETTVVVSEGTNSEGQPYRQASGMFQGKGGQALVTISMPTKTWDQAVIDQFFASIQ